MRPLLFMIGALLCFCKSGQSQAVFAHFMVGNVAFYTIEDWAIDIAAAANMGIDAFALNIAYGDDTVSASVSNAFQAIPTSGADFKLFFSFDYAGGGPWPAADVASYLEEYVGNSGYFQTASGQPFVSTFEGPANANDWVALKAQYGVFFMPDWSSLGAGPAWDLGVADGLFSWAAWPWGNGDSNTWVDASYLQVLKDGGTTGPPYMMGVSPMFYTNLPFYDKNWAWRGDRLWFDRWKEVLFLKPDYVEIITWNDWGESHYIAPIDQTQYQSVLSLGEAPFDYVGGFSHDGWTYLLPAFTSLYKTNQTSLPSQMIVAWGRSTSTNVDCSTNGTTVNTASQLQIEFPPDQALSDNIFFVVVATGEVDAPIVTIGGTQVSAGWSDFIGSAATGGTILFGNASFAGLTGEVEIKIESYGTEILSVTGAISENCTSGFTNYNMWTNYELVEAVDGTGSLSIEDYVCTAGTSVEGFSDLCEFTCALGYCPYTACICSEIGPQPDLPEAVATQCYPLASASVVYEGICHYACTYGYLDTEHCGTEDVAAPTPTVSPFNPDAATAGTGLGDNAVFTELCGFTCKYGYCPLEACSVTDTGDLVLFTGNVYDGSANFTSEPWNKLLDDLCTFSCNRGNCPDACASNVGCVSGSGEDNYSGLCGFSCGFGFCPEPCTCAVNGTVPTLPTFDPTIVGYADTGLDPDTYGPLCNFTCSHGYCPTPNACLSSITINPDEESTIPTLPTIEEYQYNTTYSSGDFFTYVSEENPDLSLDLILLNSTDIGTVSCDDVTSGSDGATLGCVGELVEFLMLSILNDKYALSASKRDVEPRANYNFATHSQWKASGNCTTTHCMLLDGVPLHNWTSVGNGSYNGALHELHFLNTGKSQAYSASRSLSSSSMTNSTSGNTTTYDKRQSLGGLRASFIFPPKKLDPLIDMDTAEYGKFDGPFIDVAAFGAMDATYKGFTVNCNAYKANSTSLANNSNNSNIAEGVMDISNPTVALAVALSSADVDNYASSCASEEEDSHTFIVYPVDGTNVDSLSELLASFPNANLEPHVSLNGWGILYWKADLTPSQVTQVTQNNECQEAVVKCIDDCENPSASLAHVDLTATYNTTAWLTKDTDPAHLTTTLYERDGGVTTQSDAPPDLWFISQPPGSDPVSGTGPYEYDSTGGKNVYVYILDNGRFDMTFPEFSAWALVPGTTQVVSSITPKIIGRVGYIPPYDDDSQTRSHGSSMLTAMAGLTQGVAKSITPVPISYDWEDGLQWILDALDWIYYDWTQRAMATLDPSLAPLAVLSMSWTYPAYDNPDGWELILSAELRRLVAAGVLPVVPSGNNMDEINTIPAVLADPTRSTAVAALLPVGSVDNDGDESDFSDDAVYLDVWAPGQDVASPYWDEGVQAFLPSEGTSQACAKTAGLAAYLIGLSSKKALYTNPQAVAADITSMAWARGSEARMKAIYNGING